jgi:hypothetical protein
VFVTIALSYNLKSGIVIPSLFFLLRIVLAILSILCFHVNFRIVFSISVKNDAGILMEVALYYRLLLVLLSLYNITSANP